MAKKQEKIIMEVTKGEAEYILYERLDNKWYVELQPIFVLAPCLGIAYLIYYLLSNYFQEWLSILLASPFIMVGFYILYLFIKRRQRKASQLYSEMVKGK